MPLVFQLFERILVDNLIFAASFVIEIFESPSKRILLTIFYELKYMLVLEIVISICKYLKPNFLHFFSFNYLESLQVLFNCIIESHHYHHHVVPLARISLILSRHFSLSFFASGRSLGLHPVSSQSC